MAKAVKTSFRKDVLKWKHHCHVAALDEKWQRYWLEKAEAEGWSAAELRTQMLDAVREWLSRIDKDAKEASDKKTFELWLGCHTQAEIAEAVGVKQPEVNKTIPNGGFPEWNKITQSQRHAANHEIDFEPPLFNVWKFKEKSNAFPLQPAPAGRSVVGINGLRTTKENN